VSNPAAGFGDGRHHDRRLGNAEAGAAHRLRHRQPEPPGLGHRLVEVEREDTVIVPFQPVIVRKTGTLRQDRVLMVCWSSVWEKSTVRSSS
jgi:hypothetical protein